MTYAGNQYGERRLYVFGSTAGTGATQASFVKTIPMLDSMVGATVAYQLSGGKAYGTTAELLPFVGNKAYETFARTSVRTLTTLDPAGGITSTVVNFTPDPRSHIGIFITGDQYGFTGEHMDEIHVTAKNGNTYQAFLGRLSFGEDNPALGTTMGICELTSYGLSGASDPTNLYEMTAGRTLMNKTNGVTGYIALENVMQFIDLEAYKGAVEGQASRTVESSGLTGITIGTGSTGGRCVFFKPFNSQLVDFCRTLAPAFGSTIGVVGGYRQNEIHTLLAGTTGNLSDVQIDGTGAIFGVTFDGVTGGTVHGTSEFTEFAHNVLHLHAKGLNEKTAKIVKIRNSNSIRDVDDCVF